MDDKINKKILSEVRTIVIILWFILIFLMCLFFEIHTDQEAATTEYNDVIYDHEIIA